MEANYSVGENVYIKTKITSVHEQTDDIRYEMITTSGTSKLFAKQTKDTIKRSPEDVDNSEGENIFLDYVRNICKMTSEQLQDCFGTSYSDIPTFFTKTKDDAPTIMALYDAWVIRTSININSIVSYTDPKTKEVKTCIVVAVDEDTNSKKRQFTIYHHDEKNDIHEFLVTTDENLKNLQVAVNIDPYLDTLGDAVDQATEKKDDSGDINEK